MGRHQLPQGSSTYLLTVWYIRGQVRHRLFMQSKYHLTVQLLNYSVGITLVADFFDLIHYLVYSGDGHGVPALHAVSVVLTAVSEAVLLLLVVLIAKGWTITSRKLSASGRVKIGVYTTLYLFLNLAAIFWCVYMPPSLNPQQTRNPVLPCMFPNLTPGRMQIQPAGTTTACRRTRWCTCITRAPATCCA